MLKIGTLFSGGLAACEFAFRYEKIEHEIVFACEWDKFARQQYESFHGLPTLNFYEDVSDMQGHKYRDSIDLIVWGSPCQDLSLAGKRKGFDGAKSSLFREGARIMSEVMPKAFIFENVKGLLSSNGGADYKEVIKTFQDMGYLIAMKVMNTKDYGVPQNRERVFIVGFLDDDAYHSFSFEDGFELETRLKYYLNESVDEKYYLSDKIIKNFINGKSDFNFEPHSRDAIVSKCLTARYYKMEKTDPYIKEPKILQRARGYNNGGLKDICPTLTINSFEHNNHVVEDYRIRKLTPKECFKLQGVRESCIDLVVSDSQAYKIAGNAISVNVMQSLLRSLYKPVSKKGSLF